MMRIAAILLCANSLWAACTGSSPTLTAASASQADVSACVTAAADGDTILIPNGSSTWTSGISTTKQIHIRAQNYTATSGGATSRNVILTNNSSSPMFQMQSGNTHNVSVSGIQFLEGSGDINFIRFTGSGTKVPLLNDCTFEVKNRFGNEPDIAAISWLSLGGVGWNLYIEGINGDGIGGQCCPEGAGILINSPRTWETASTMGAADTDGSVNVYFEDSTLKNVGQSPDVDDNGRFVMRYSLLDGAWGLTHGFTSLKGGRHVEYYNNTFTTTTTNRNMAARYFWFRAGTGIFTDSVVNTQNHGYGTPVLVDSGDNTTPTGYPQARQPGWGNNGSTSVIDPIYLWNNTGAGAYTWRVQTDWTSYIQADREVYANNGAKPGYSKYTYPHPARAAIEGGGSVSYSRQTTGKVTRSGKVVSQ